MHRVQQHIDINLGDGRPTFEYCAPGARYGEAMGRFQCDIVIPLAPL